MTDLTRTLFLAATAALAVPIATSADTVTLTKTHSGRLGVFGTESLFDTVRIGGDNMNTMNVYAGGFHVSDDTDDFVAWCIELSETLKLPFTYDVVSSPFVQSATDKLSQLFTGFVADIDTGVESAAFQVAIWELISDTKIDLDAGEFQLLSNQAVASQANDYLTGLSTFDPNYDPTFFVADGTQDLVTGQPSPVPLPASGLLLLAGLGAIGAASRKRR